MGQKWVSLGPDEYHGIMSTRFLSRKHIIYMCTEIFSNLLIHTCTQIIYLIPIDTKKPSSNRIRLIKKSQFSPGDDDDRRMEEKKNNRGFLLFVAMGIWVTLRMLSQGLL